MRHAWWLFILFWFVLHVPFLEADPFVKLSHSRDAFTDEGLNTSQVRNWANHGEWDIWECDNLIKNPLFNALLALPFKVFGTSWLTARLTVLLSVLSLLLFSASLKPIRAIITLIILVVFTQMHVFYYSHFSMAEMVAVASVIAAVSSWVNYALHPHKKRNDIWLYISLFFATVAWWMKIQFAYLVFLVPVSTWILWLFAYHHKKRGKKLFISSISLILAIGLSILLYITIWYYPHREAWMYIMDDQATGRFPHWKYLLVVGKFNFLQYFNQPALWTLLGSFILSVPVSIWLLIKHRSPNYLSLFIISGVWVMLETHKIFIHHVPGRYLVSLIVAMGLFSCIVWFQLFFQKFILFIFRQKKENNRKYLLSGVFAGFILLITIVIHLFQYGLLLNQRTFVIKNVFQYVKKNTTGNEVAIGVWSPSLTWGTKIRAVPVWNEFLNYRNILETFRPRIIFSETEEQDSNGAFSADGIILTELADSVKNYTVGKWPVNLYWINSEKMNQMIQHRKTIHEKL
jgi:hypothetical protein